MQALQQAGSDASTAVAGAREGLQLRLRAARRELALTPEMLDEIRRPRTF
jgi:hypothetical protein